MGPATGRPSPAELLQELAHDDFSRTTHRPNSHQAMRSAMAVQFNERSASSRRDSAHVIEQENAVPVAFCKAGSRGDFHVAEPAVRRTADGPAGGSAGGDDGGAGGESAAAAVRALVQCEWREEVTCRVLGAAEHDDAGLPVR